MKKTLCLLLIISVALAYGCSIDEPSNINDSDFNLPPIQIENPNLNAALDLRLILSYSASEYRSYKPSDDFVARWEDYIAEKYDLGLEVVYHRTLMSSQLDEAEEGTSKFNIEQLNELTKKGGLVYAGINSDLIELYNLGLIEPLNDFPDIMAEINILDEAVTRAVSNSEGVILGYPLMQKTYAAYRIYNGDWIKKWGEPVPRTLEEFADYARFVRNGDPDGDGEMNTYVMRYSNMMLREFADIFRAFGCYTYNYGPFGYDPFSENIENCFAGDGFKEALAYIKTLKDEDLLFDCMSTEAYKVEHPHGFGTAFMVYDENTDVASSNLEAGFYLLGPNTENLIPISQGYGSIAVLKGTQDAAAKLEKFIDVFKINPNAYIDFDLGIDGETFEEYDEYFYSLFSYNNAIWNKMNIRTDIGIDSEKYKPTVNVHNMENQYVELSLSPAELAARTMDLYRIMLLSMNQKSTGSTYTQDIDNYTNELHMMNIKLSSNIVQQLSKVMKGQMSIDDASDSLKNIVNNLGFQDAIDCINYDRQN